MVNSISTYFRLKIHIVLGEFLSLNVSVEFFILYEEIKTDFIIQNNLLKLCVPVVNSQWLSLVQKLVLNVGIDFFWYTKVIGSRKSGIRFDI